MGFHTKMALIGPSWTILVLWGILALLTATISLLLVVFYALRVSQTSTVPKHRLAHTPAHLLVVLGSGGHTAEMFSMLRRMRLDPRIYTFRTYIVSSGDNFSAQKAVEFEAGLAEQQRVVEAKGKSTRKDSSSASYDIVTVPRARRVHQSYFTAPLSTLQCLWACLLVLRGRHQDQKALWASSHTSSYPDLILTNGPATAVCVILAAKLLRLYNFCLPLLSPKQAGRYRLRTIFVESWARVTSLSLSGKLLLPLVDRFLVQWPKLEGRQAWKGMRKTEYVGTIVD